MTCSKISTKIFKRNSSRIGFFSTGIFLFVAAGLFACGGDGSKNNPKASTSKIDGLFSKAAGDHKLPKRMMVATAWLESKMTSTKASSYYLNSDTGEYDTQKGVLLAQTAFGISREKLGLTESETPDSLDVQIDAYGAWISGVIAEEVDLDASPKSAGEKFDWIWQIARAHREGAAYSRNVRVIFAKELIEVLNEGFTWQDPVNGEILEFPKENPQLLLEDFGPDVQNLFNLTTQRPEIDSATYLRLGRVNSDTIENKANHIEVIHCPLSLSACLELQNQEIDDEIRLEAHYIIPQNGDLVPEPLQVAKHKNAVRITNSKGITTRISDAIVVMLVGNSGRMVNGYRDPANPRWLTKWQLQRMGDIVNDVCLNLKENNGVKVEDCMDLNRGVRFHEQGASEAYRWGDIADFDSLIFSAYILNPGGLQGDTAFEFPGNKLQYEAGASIPIRVLFRPAVRFVEMERLVRCPDKKLVWAPIASEDVRSQTVFSFNKKFFDSGPNSNGNQFFRAKVYDASGELLGWDTAQIYLKNFEKESSTVTPKTCLLRGN